MPRVPIPDETAARALFYSDRLCCICRVPRKPVQIHHIDDNHSNNVLENLAVLCMDCHTETQVKGGFGRKLDATQVRLYRDDWWGKVGRSSELSRMQSTETGGERARGPFVVEASRGDQIQKQKRVASHLKKMEQGEQLITLVFRYNRAGQTALRDKYIDKILLDKNVDVEIELLLRSMQGKVHLVDMKKVQIRLDRMKEVQDWSQLARAYWHLGRFDEAVEYYCLTCVEAMREGRPFSAGYYLKEMLKHKVNIYLFERALQLAKEKDDIWWQIRSLQELGREDEIDDLLLENRDLVEREGRQPELKYLKAALKRRGPEAGESGATPAS